MIFNNSISVYTHVFFFFYLIYRITYFGDRRRYTARAWDTVKLFLDCETRADNRGPVDDKGLIITGELNDLSGRLWPL